MNRVWRIIIGLTVVFVIAACATQEEAPQEAEAQDQALEEAQPEPAESVQEADAQDEAAPLDEPGIAAFRSADGTTFRSETIVTLPTGGPPEGQLLPTSTSDEVTLYVTRDGSVPSAENNWGGPIDPESPPPISRPLEGVASYRVVAELDGEYSEPFTLTVNWEHESSPDLQAPTFLVDGSVVSGSVTIPVSRGDDPQSRLQISCEYEASTLYITRDGSEPSADNYWETQTCQGTYLWSPEPTAAEYRVVAVWQGTRSPVASLSVEWVDE